MSTSLFEIRAESLAHQVTSGLLSIGLALKSRAWKVAGAHRISPTQGQILAMLHSGSHETSTLSSLARSMCITSPTASEAVCALAKKGLVRKVRSHSDARKVSITLSAKGQRKAERVSAWTDVLTEAAETLTHAEQEVFLHTLTKLIRALPHSDDGLGQWTGRR